MSQFFIEDDELRELYRTTSEDRLTKLEVGFLELERASLAGNTPALTENRSLWDELLREAHSLKGDSRMLGVQPVETLIHQVEHILKRLQRQELQFASPLSDRLYETLDALRQIVHEATHEASAQQPSQIESFRILAALIAVSDPPLLADMPAPSSVPSETSPSASAPSETSIESESASRVNPPGQDAASVSLEPAIEPVGTAAINQADAIGATPTDAIPSEPETRPPSQTLPPAVIDQPQERQGDRRDERRGDRRSGVPSGPGGSGSTALDYETYRIETLRVETRHLDWLMARASELTIIGQQSDRSLEEWQSLIHAWRELRQSLERQQRALLVDQRLSHQAPTSPGSSSLRPGQGPGSLGLAGGSSLGSPSPIDPLIPRNGSAAGSLANATSTPTSNTTSTPTSTPTSFRSSLGPDRFSPIQQCSGRSLSEQLDKFEQLLETTLSTTRNRVDRLQTLTGSLDDRIRQLRLLPLSTVFQRLSRPARDLGHSQGKAVDLVIEGGDTTADKQIIEALQDPLVHLIRNAIDHGLELPADRQRLGKPATGKLHLRADRQGSRLMIELSDDGQGLDLAAIRQKAIALGMARPEDLANLSHEDEAAFLADLLFRPGFSTRQKVTEVSGRGVGLDVVRTTIERLKGTVRIVNPEQTGQGCTVRLELGTTVSTVHALLVQIGEMIWALPGEVARSILLLANSDCFNHQGRPAFWYEEEPVALVHLADLLGLSEAQRVGPNVTGTTGTNGALGSGRADQHACLVIAVGDRQLGLWVDAVLAPEEVVLKPLSPLLATAKAISGATILPSGNVCLLLNPGELLAQAKQQAGLGGPMAAPVALAPQRSPRILLVEDSIAVRTQEKRILEAEGYQVTTAVDGLDGWHKLRSSEFDAVLSDVQMPNMSGLELTERIREQPEYDELPILLLTSLASEDDRRRGAEAGANAYLTKGDFDRTLLLETLGRLI